MGIIRCSYTKAASILSLSSIDISYLLRPLAYLAIEIEQLWHFLDNLRSVEILPHKWVALDLELDKLSQIS